MAEKENKAHRLICKHRYGLTFEQQRFLETDKRNSNINSDGNLVRLARQCFKNDQLDEHSDEFKNVRRFLIMAVKRGNECFNLTDEQIEFVKEKGKTMRPADIGRALFPDAISPLSKEFKTIRELALALDVEFIDKDKKVIDEWIGDYEPPKQEAVIMKIINEVDPSANYNSVTVKNDPVRRDNLDALKNFLQNPRFIFMASSIKRAPLRRFFEKKFIHCVYNKPHLNVNDLDGYISLCDYYVQEMMIKEIVQVLNDRISEAAGDDSDTGKKLTMTLTEALSAKIGEAKDIRNAIKDGLKVLNVSLAIRMKNATEENRSLNRFIELVQHEKGRETLLRLADIQNEKVRAEAKRITDFDELIAQIWGTSTEELMTT